MTLGSMIAILCVVCCSPRSVPPGTASTQKILFGQGGGVTGIRIEYILEESGHLFRQHAWSDSVTYLQTLDPRFVAQTFRNFTNLGLDTVSCNNPGDLYYFIEMHKDGKSYSLVWGYPGFKPPEEVVQYFNNLYRSAKRHQQ